MKNLIIAGYSGSGKSVIGRSAAEQLGFEFVEIAEMMRSITGLMPDQMLKKHGAVRYRSEEKLLFQKLAIKEKQVIALESLLCERERLFLLKPNSFFVLLRADTELLLRRLQKRGSRRLAFNDLSADISRFEDMCMPLCDFVLKVGEYNIENTAALIIKEFRK